MLIRQFSNSSKAHSLRVKAESIFEEFRQNQGKVFKTSSHLVVANKENQLKHFFEHSLEEGFKDYSLFLQNQPA